MGSPTWNSRIADHSAMDEIEDAMHRKCSYSLTNSVLLQTLQQTRSCQRTLTAVNRVCQQQRVLGGSGVQTGYIGNTSNRVHG